MTQTNRFATGLSLLLAASFSTLAMAMHPYGGNLQQIIHIRHTLLFSHAIALACIPLLAFGYAGLTALLRGKSAFAMLGFSFIVFGLETVMIAGILTGLVLPDFASAYQTSTAESVAGTIAGYAFIFNHALAYVFICAVMIATTIWSLIIIQTKLLPAWLGYYGCSLAAATALAAIFHYNFTSVGGFRLFSFVLVSWQLAAAILLMQTKSKKTIV